jgi:L-seryl-tRNA(Ser) seleniumtransferase
MPDRRRELPSVEALLSHPLLEALEGPRVLKRRAAREVLDEARRQLAGEPGKPVDRNVLWPELDTWDEVPGAAGAGEIASPPALPPGPALDALAARAAARAGVLTRPGLRPVVNATGVVVHTNLGRSILSEAAQAAVAAAAGRYSTLELDVESGERGSRLAAVRDLLRQLTGAGDALAVNNNAAAVLLALSGLAAGREVVVSRGELIEIGGSFRLPEIMARSGARLREVGTTNKTHPEDYARAIGPDTALLLKVHRSNFVMQGFVAEVGLAELVAIGRAHGVPVVEDLGSGALLDLRQRIAPEPTARESLAAGASLVLFSGDKLLGGPQAGILVGEAEMVRRLAQDPMARALRLDKLSIAALEATLRAYLEPERAWAEIPTLRLLGRPAAELEREAVGLAEAIGKADPELEAAVVPVVSRVGGGALPMAALGSAAVALRPRRGSVEALEAELRKGVPPILGRLEEGRLVLDVRTLLAGDAERIVEAVGERAQVRRRGHR